MPLEHDTLVVPAAQSPTVVHHATALNAGVVDDVASVGIDIGATHGDLALQVAALTRLHELAMQLGGPLELRSALNAILEATVEFHGAKAGMLSLYDEPAGILYPAASIGLDEAAIAKIGRVVPGLNAGACGSAFTTGKRVVIFDTETDQRFECYRDDARGIGFRSVHSTPILTRSGGIIGVLSVHFVASRQPTKLEMQFADVCARHAADVVEVIGSQEALRENERRYRHLIQALPAAVYATDAQGRITLYNEAASALWGRDPKVGEDRWCGSHKMYLPDGTSLPLDFCPMATTLKEDRSLNRVEVVVERPDGSRRDVLAHPQPIHDSNGAMIGAINILVDISERKEAERAMRESEERFRNMADNAPVMIWVANVDGRYSYLSRSWYEFTGQPPNVAAAAALMNAIHPGDRAAVAKAFVDAYAKREAFRIEYRLHRADGLWRWAMDAAVPRLGDDGVFLGYIGSVIDITERKQMEDDLRRINSELEEFAYVTSHDLHEPLRTVNIYAEKLLQHQVHPDEEARICVEFIRSGLKRMEQLIADLLSYSRTIHQDEHRPQPVALAAPLERALSVLQNRIEETNAEIIADELPAVLGEETQLAQVFQNLLSNALKYAKAGVAPRIVIDARRHSGECVISVRDNGIGFDQKHAARVFGLFKRLHRDEYPGTGLGLAICKRIIERHGGRIWVESEPGVGSVFSFALPAVNE